MKNILLTSLTAVDIVPYIIGALLIAGMIYYIYTTYKKNPDGDKKLVEFLDGIQDIIKTHIIEAINNFDFSNAKDSFAQVQAEFLESMYTDIWEICTKEIDKLADTDTVLYALLKKVITKEKIEEYTLAIFADDTIQEKLTEVYNIALKDKVEAIEAEDKELEKTAEEYENETVETEEVPVLDPQKLTPDETQEIVPPVEEESDAVDADDPAVEVLPESEQNIDLNLNDENDSDSEE